ncbi:MAG: DUF2793 domain-containing protein [Robiginitomaculum sp.]|nr:DUF2793 domain-containing protein [Robiginitomaculum sp.]
MSENTKNISFPYLVADQAQKHVTVNQSLGIIDDLLHLSVESQSLNAPPLNPVEGQRYIPAANSQNEWAGKEQQIAAYRDGAWFFIHR